MSDRIPEFHIDRLSDDGRATLGHLIDGDERVLCKTVELPWKGNRHDVSCIPPGEYFAFRRPNAETRHDYDVFELEQVPGRQNIQIHIANVPHELRGCIAVGTGFGTFPGGERGVVASRDAYALWMQRNEGINRIKVTITAARTSQARDMTDPTPHTSQIFSYDPARPNAGYVSFNGVPMRVMGTTIAPAEVTRDAVGAHYLLQDPATLETVVGPEIDVDDYLAFAATDHGADVPAVALPPAPDGSVSATGAVSASPAASAQPTTHEEHAGVLHGLFSALERVAHVLDNPFVLELLPPKYRAYAQAAAAIEVAVTGRPDPADSTSTH